MAASPVNISMGDIPPFTPSGALPPFLGNDPSVHAGLSPYQTTLTKLVDRFATSPERKKILDGFLKHRAALLSLGIIGFQWLDGSFLEDIETLKNRPPADIDIVTFVWRPQQYVNDQAAWDVLIQQNLGVFDPTMAKATYQTDPYFVDIIFGPQFVIQQTAYWFGLFSHQRVTSLWKGMLMLPLDTHQDDAAAAQLLASK
jgi:hypothetical protein